MLISLAIAAPIMLLILKQPDFSTAVTFLPMITGMLFCAGADVLQLLFVFGYGALTLAFPLVYTLCQVRFPNAVPGSLPALVIATSKMGWATLAVMLVIAALSASLWRLATWMLRLQVKPVGFIVRCP